MLLVGCATPPPPARSPPPPEVRAPASAPREVDADERGEEIAALALRLRGTPYRYGGATRAGFDCSGLVFYTHRQFGVLVPRTSREQAKQAQRIKTRKLQRGDLVFFRIGASRHINHVGIYLGDRRFVHAPGAGKPVTVNTLDEEYYEKRFEFAGRYWDRKAQ